MNLTNKFPLEKIKDVLFLPLKEINSMELLTEAVSKDVSEEYGEFSFSAGGEAGIKIQLFNDADDDNNDPLAAELELDKEISRGFAFVSYELLAKVKGSLKTDIDYLSLGLSKVNEVSHASYLKHNNNITLAEAIAKNVSRFKIAFDWDSISNLENYETLSIWTRGSLSVDAQVSVSDTFTPLLSGISKLLKAADTISVKMDMSASLKVSVNIADYFQTTISRRDVDDKKLYNVTVRKESKNAKQVHAAVGVTAAISTPEVVLETINKIIDQGETAVAVQWEKLKGKTWNKLTGKEQAFIEASALLLGLDVTTTGDDLLKRYSEKREDIVAKIQALVESELKLSISYTYEHTKEAKALIKGVFSEKGLKENFKNVLLLKTKEIYSSAISNKAEVKISDYLDLTKISIVKAMKIGFTISDFELSQLVKKTVEFQDQVLRDDNSSEEIQSVSFSSTKFTAEKFGVFKERENSVSLSGSHRGTFQPLISMSNLDYEFTLHWSESFRKLKDTQLKKVLDFAVTWGIIEENSFEQQFIGISEILKDKKKVRLSAFFKIKEGLFDSVIDPIINLSDYSFQQSLAAALPYADYDGRQLPSQRRDVYYSFFNRYLKEKSGSDIDYDKVRQIIAEHLNQINKPELARFEEFGDNKFQPLNKVLEHNFIAFNFNRFKIAMALLNDNRKDFKTIIKSSEFLRNLNSIRLQPEFNMRFLGRMLSQICADRGIEAALERTMTIEYKDDKDSDSRYVLAR